MPSMKKINICGVDFSNISSRELMYILKEKLRGSAQNCFIVTPNVDFIVRANSDIKFREVLNSSELSLCDSAIVKIASTFLGNEIEEKITGSDLLNIVCTNLEGKTNFFVLGAKQEIVKISAHNLEQMYPNVNITGFHHGYFGENKDRRIINMINASNPEVLIIGMGSPRQELWVDKNKGFLKIKIILCVGGILDVLAGKIKRAPAWMQKAGLEWFWRLIKDPKRLWKRYLIDDMHFFYLLLKESVKNKS
jgi:N-acetylglucosaminyldiphosphoundecaprenol N-acetyl-beta-D-mannosaminyltransferase